MGSVTFHVTLRGNCSTDIPYFVTVTNHVHTSQLLAAERCHCHPTTQAAHIDRRLTLSTFPHLSNRMKARDYCCCAIPVVNFGIYSTLVEQFALGIVAGTLSIATPESNTTAPILSYSLLNITSRSRRRCDSFACPLDFCCNLLCRRPDSNTWFYRCRQGSCSFLSSHPWLFTPSGHRKTAYFLEDTSLCISLSQ